MSGTLATTGPLHLAEAALMARLAEAFPPAQFALGHVPARLTQQGWSRLLRRTPFIGLGWRGVTLDPQAGRLPRGEMQWSVFLAARHEASPAARLVGSPQGPGLFGLTQVAVARLHGLVIPDVGSVSVTGIDNATIDGWDDEGVAIAALSLGIGFALDDPAGLAALDEFLRAGATWEFTAGVDAASDLINVRG